MTSFDHSVFQFPVKCFEADSGLLSDVFPDGLFQIIQVQGFSDECGEEATVHRVHRIEVVTC